MVAILTSRMTPAQFVKKWRPVMLTERASAHSHFNDLCDLLDHPKPLDVDPTGREFTFEKGVQKSGGGEGFADVWKRNYFAWEYKKKKRNLDAALDQLSRYALALENPPLHIVCDTDRFRIVTAYTNSVPKAYDISLDDILDNNKRSWLESAFHSPTKLKPGADRADLTKDAANRFSSLVESLLAKGNDPERVSHFVNQLVFLFFAEDVGLLKDNYFRRVLATLSARPTEAKAVLDEIFAVLQTGGRFGLDRLPWINGGLFDGREALSLEGHEIGLLKAASSQAWGHIDPTIFGTLFERFLDPEKRAQIGAHYTDVGKIMKIVEPVILRPLRDEWNEAKKNIEALISKAIKKGNHTNKFWKQAEERRSIYLERLKNLSVLDPACGSGNFLYVALREIKNLEHAINQECEALGLPPRWPMVGPEILHGIEINPIAAELARTTIWIGDIQWGVQNGFSGRSEPLLRKLESIETADALIDAKGRDSRWPPADFIVGNPPFLGGKRMRGALGPSYCDKLFARYADRVPAEADLVCYWLVRARELGSRAGFVVTNSIRGGANRRVLEPLAKARYISSAWSDEPWTLDGAAVRVSLICWGKEAIDAPLLNGLPVIAIYPDLTGGSSDLTTALPLRANANVAFMGVTKGGSFEIDGKLARKWLSLPTNTNGRSNSEVLKRRVSGLDITRRPQDMWLIDFGTKFDEDQAAVFSQPYAHIKREVFPLRQANNRDLYKRFWWRHVESRPALISKISRLERYIATTIHAKYRIFTWQGSNSLPDNAVIAFAKDDDTFMGILHSRLHEIWSLALGTSLEDRPRYTPSSTFETFPFPNGLTPDIPAAVYASDPRAKAISSAAQGLMSGRDHWLNPPELVVSKPEVVRGYPNRLLPINADAESVLKARTMTSLYNQRGTPEGAWLDKLHRVLDEAVFAAYGWPSSLSDDEALAKLLALNFERRAVS